MSAPKFTPLSEIRTKHDGSKLCDCDACLAARARARAAPEMYEALKGLVMSCELDDLDTDDGQRTGLAALDQARAALAKARGESNG